MPNPPLRPETLRRYAQDTDRMAQQLENSEHGEAASAARELEHQLNRLIDPQTTSYEVWINRYSNIAHLSRTCNSLTDVPDRGLRHVWIDRLDRYQVCRYCARADKERSTSVAD